MNLSEKIDLYLDGLLNDNEKLEIEKRIEKDPEFAGKVLEWKSMDTMISNFLEYPKSKPDGRQRQPTPDQPLPPMENLSPSNDLINPGFETEKQLSPRQELEINDDLFRFYLKAPVNDLNEQRIKSRIEHSFGQRGKNSRYKKMTFLRMAAGFGLVIILTVAIFTFLKERQFKRKLNMAYETYYNPFLDSNLSTLANEAGFSTFTEVQKTLGEVKIISRNDGQSSLELLLSGVNQMHYGNFETAKSDLSAGMESSELSISDAAKWYYSLILIKEKEVPEATRLLNQLSSSGSVYAKQSEQIMESLSWFP